jgi:hypothetical protein
MSNKTITQPSEQINVLFVDHCSHLNFSETNPDLTFEDASVGSRNAKHIDEYGNNVIGGPGNCHRSNQTI